MVLTAELEAVVSTEVLAGETLKVEAAAGSGKSTALRLHTTRRPKSRTLFLTFTAAEALAKSIDYERRGLKLVTVRTLHPRAHAATLDLHRGNTVESIDFSAAVLARLTETASMEWPPSRRAALRRVRGALPRAQRRGTTPEARPQFGFGARAAALVGPGHRAGAWRDALSICLPRREAV